MRARCGSFPSLDEALLGGFLLPTPFMLGLNYLRPGTISAICYLRKMIHLGDTHVIPVATKAPEGLSLIL